MRRVKGDSEAMAQAAPSAASLRYAAATARPRGTAVCRLYLVYTYHRRALAAWALTAWSPCFGGLAH